MARAWRIGLAAALWVIAGTAPPPPLVTDLRPITLQPGVNRVPGFLPGGGAATIVEGWRGNGNAHGFHVWLVLGGASEGHPVGVVGIEGGDGDPVHTTVSDNPFDGERVLGVVQFAFGRVAGQPATLLVRADLDEAPSGVLADHATAPVRWYRLDHHDDAIGRTTDLFRLIGTAHSARRYCNTELALRDLAGMPLPADYAGPNRADGCFRDG